MVGWLVDKTPLDFGLVRWWSTRKMLATALRVDDGIGLSTEAIRWQLHQASF
ncbi:MAG: hypothetical protein NZ899_07425 [Thermoguttaceae bacterium]|nr:hypothetical protein [Thermoguttaceae bacterium]MDW8078973.1 hypothetical protein [Thermoguttaceae bacterium]